MHPEAALLLFVQSDIQPSADRASRHQYPRVMRWLPYEFDGARTVNEVMHDLVVIAGNPWGRDETHLTVSPGDGEMLGETGPLSLAARDPHSVVLLISGVEIADFQFADFRGAWLCTLDEADYYVLKIDLGSKAIELSDAYNGL